MDPIPVADPGDMSSNREVLSLKCSRDVGRGLDKKQLKFGMDLNLDAGAADVHSLKTHTCSAKM